MKDIYKNKFMNKLHNQSGETLAETLVAALVAALGALLFASMMTTSTRLIGKSEKDMTKYYNSISDFSKKEKAKGSATLHYEKKLGDSTSQDESVQIHTIGSDESVIVQFTK
jgi:Tfp pilus assembly protein PilV